MTLKTRLSVLFVSTPVLAFVVVGGLMGKATARGDQTYQHLRVFEDVVSLVMNNYVEAVKVDRVMEGAMRGLADGLDPDSAFLSAKQVRAVEAGETLPDGDVGVELTRQYYLRVIAARDGSAGGEGRPADRRLRPRDRRQADARHVGLRRQPAAARPAGLEGRPDRHPRQRRRSARVDAGAREAVRARRSPARSLGTDAGYIRIAIVPAGCHDGLEEADRRPLQGGAKSLIIDLRRTAEGPVDNGIAAARLFVKSGTLRSGERSRLEDGDQDRREGGRRRDRHAR